MPRVVAMPDLAELVGDLAEIARQIKALEAQKRDVAGLVLSRLDADGVERWEDEFLSAQIVEQPGRESVDIAALKAAGLSAFIRTGDPVRYVTVRRK